MTEQPHDDITYTMRDYGKRDDFTYNKDGSGFDISGRCPACHGPTTSHHPLGSPQGYKSIWPTGHKASEPPLPDGDTTVVCECGYPHANRPADSSETGCGAAWTVDLEWPVQQ